MSQRLILRPQEVDRICGISKSSRYRLEASGRFPRRILVIDGGRASGYFADEISSWLDSRPRAVTSPAAA